MIDIILSVTRPHEELSLRLPSDSTVIVSKMTATKDGLTVQFAKPDNEDFIVYFEDSGLEVDSLYFSALSVADNSMNLQSHMATPKNVEVIMSLNAKTVIHMSVPCVPASTSMVTVEVTRRRDVSVPCRKHSTSKGAGGALVAPAAGAGGAPVSEDEDEIVDLTDPDVVCLDDLRKRKR